MAIPIDTDYLTRTLADLICINSVNPTLVPGGPGEAEIAAYVGDSLRRSGLEVETLATQPGRVSVVGTLGGSGGGRSLMLNAHMDTVGVEGMPNAFVPVVRDGRMYGRGAYDMKGSLAACMTAAKALADAPMLRGLTGDVLVAAVADEEYASIGMEDVLKHFGAKLNAAIVTEATELEICLAHKGFAWLEVETTGRAAHGSCFNEGIDANLRMGRFLAELEKLEQELRSRTAHPLVGPPSLHAALLQGGTGLSTYSPSCKLQIERRTIPGETQAQVLDELEAITRRLAAADPTFKATVRPRLCRGPFEVARDAPIVRALHQATAAVLGREPTYAGRPFWMDAALLAEAGVETAVIGPVGAGAHADEEWVDLESLVNLAQILAQTAARFAA